MNGKATCTRLENIRPIQGDHRLCCSTSDRPNDKKMSHQNPFDKLYGLSVNKSPAHSIPGKAEGGTDSGREWKRTSVNIDKASVEIPSLFTLHHYR